MRNQHVAVSYAVITYLRDVLMHNKPLVPTRNGEAPLLAAYARRSAS